MSEDNINNLSRDERSHLIHSIIEGDVKDAVVMGWIDGKTRLFVGNQSKEFTITWLRQVADSLERGSFDD